MKDKRHNAFQIIKNNIQQLKCYNNSMRIMDNKKNKWEDNIYQINSEELAGELLLKAENRQQVIYNEPEGTYWTTSLIGKIISSLKEINHKEINHTQFFKKYSCDPIPHCYYDKRKICDFHKECKY